MSPTSADYANERPDPARDEGPVASAPQFPRQKSIKRRVVQLVLVPSVVALLLWFATSGFLVFEGFYNRAVANSVRQVSIPAVSALSSIQQERRLSIAYLARPSGALYGLLEQRKQSDVQLAALRRVADDALARAPQSILDRWRTLTGYLDQLPATRSAIDARSTGSQSAYDFYNDLLDAATDLFDTQARVVPDVTATQGGIIATEVFRAGDMMSRAASTIDGAVAARSLPQSEYLEFVGLVSAYHYALANVAVHLEPEVRERLAAMQASDPWKQLTAAENTLITAGPWGRRVPADLGSGGDRWSQLTSAVSADLIDLTVRQADQVSAKALRTGNNQLLTASLGSLLALLVAVAAIAWAVRQSRVLVDRALSVRLARLGTDAGNLVDERLPAVMERLRRREPVDLATEFATPTYGSDEIGQVALVINRSLQAAAGAAVDEAKARAAGTAMLMGVARRPQRPLQRGLKVVEDLQSQIGDEKLLTDLFDIHHQLNQTRRFLENLVILAGGQIGRRFQNPVPLRRVLLAASAEARDYQRITLRGATDVSLLGHAVAEVIHLVAELLDNALAFSPPGTTVWLSSNKVRHGVAVEIEDAGVGLSAEAVDRANTLLATAPTPDVTELRDGAQIGLHVIAELAKREGVEVSLRRSAYGGLLAIVLLPERILATGRNGPGGGSGGEGSADTRQMPVMVAAPHPEPWSAQAEAPAVGNRSAVGVLEPAPVPDRQPKIAISAVDTPRADGPPARPAGEETPVAGTAIGTATLGVQATARPPLPRRRPQHHLAPELREEPPADAAPTGPVRSPEEARSRFARYQQGWALGLATSNDDHNPNAEQGRNA